MCRFRLETWDEKTSGFLCGKIPLLVLSWVWFLWSVSEFKYFLQVSPLSPSQSLSVSSFLFPSSFSYPVLLPLTPSLPLLLPCLGLQDSTVPGRVPKGAGGDENEDQISFNQTLPLFAAAVWKAGFLPLWAWTCQMPDLGWAPGPQPQTTVYGISKCSPSAVQQAINISFCNGEMGPWEKSIRSSCRASARLPLYFHPNCIIAV